MIRKNSEIIHSSLEQQFEDRETIEFPNGKVEVVDIKPDVLKTETPVLVAPGWAATTDVFKENILRLAEHGRRTISVDSPHGIEAESVENFSDIELRKVAAIMEFLDEKGIDQIDAVGHSEAGIYLTIAATLYPERFRNLVLVNPSGMIGKDKPEKLSARFSVDIIRQVVRSIKDKTMIKPIAKAALAAGKSVGSDPLSSFKEVLAMSGTQIQDLLRDLKEKGVGISIIHSVDDQAFPMGRVQDTATADQLDGFYSVKGTHNELYLHPERYTDLVDSALDALESKHNKK